MGAGCCSLDKRYVRKENVKLNLRPEPKDFSIDEDPELMYSANPKLVRPPDSLKANIGVHFQYTILAESLIRKQAHL
jgi:hypothetical protein